MPEEHNDQTRSYIPLSKGTKVSHYTIIEKIGAGGMGEVFLAEDTKLKRKAALKFMPVQHATDKDFRTRFIREAEATANLNHPNIITIYEVDEYLGRPYFAMELVEGLSLRDYHKDKELEIERIVELAIQICDGLGAAHDKNIIHRDIKPSNIVIDSYGRPKILDFGLAAIQGKEHLTKTGSTLGTVGYMSPEQVNGKAVDERSDLFSFGLVLYELIAGKSPFRRDNDVATLKAISNDPPEPLARYKNEVPDELQRVVSKLLEKDPAYRYQTAAGVVSDLKQVLRTISSGEVSSQTMIQARESSGGKSMKVMLSTAVIIIVALLIVLKPWKIEISSTDEAQAADNVIAVMYFDNIVDPADEKRLGEIIANLLISDLSNANGIKVVSSQRLYDILKLLGQEGVKQIDRNVASQIAEKAKARWMLTGSILRTEPSIVLTAQLIEVPTGNILTSPRITGEAGEDIFSLANKLTIGITESLLLPEVEETVSDFASHKNYTNSTEAYRYYLDGWDKFRKVKIREGLESYDRAIELDSNFTMAYYAKAIIMSDTKKHIDKAVELIDRVGRKDQLFIRALREFKYANIDMAIELYEQIIKEYPQEKLAYFQLGIIYMGPHRRELEKAAIFLEKTIEIDPMFKNAYNLLAYTYSSLGQHEKSIWAINKYIELVPDEANPYDSRGEIFGFNGELDKAIESFKKALEVDPEFLSSSRQLALFHLLNGDYEDADKLINKLAGDERKSVRSFARQARPQISLYRGNIDEAIERMNLAIEMYELENNPKQIISRKGYLQKITLYIGIGYLTNDKSWFDSLKIYLDKAEEELKSDSTYSKIVRRSIYEAFTMYASMVGDKEAAYTYLDKSNIYRDTINSVMDKRFSHIFEGIIAFSFGDYDLARSIWEPVVQVEKSSILMYKIGACHLKTGRLGEAVEMLEKGIKRVDAPTGSNLIHRVIAQYDLALAYEESGWKEKAIIQYEEVIEIWKESDDRNFRYLDAKERLAKLKAAI